MKKFLLVILMLTLTLAFYPGSADAIYGAWDKVPGQDIAVALHCDQDGAGWNTTFAIASTVAQSAHYWVYDYDSSPIFDQTWTWTPNEVLSSDCYSLISQTSPENRADFEVGDQWWGYIVFSGDSLVNALMGWSYILNTELGFSSSGIVLEGEDGLFDLCEDGGAECIMAATLYPRYYILNDNAESGTDWIFLTGDPAFDTSGYICNEDEECESGIEVDTDEFSIVSVEPYIPVWLFADYPKAGFAILGVDGGDQDETVLCKAHQKAQAASVLQTWDVTHRCHRDYP